MDNNGLPTFSKKNIDLISTFVKNDSNYRVPENANSESYSKLFLDNKFPENKDDLEKAVRLIDKENSTHLAVKDSINMTVNKIIEMGLENVKNRIKDGDPTVVNEITKANPHRMNFSFASKFCTYCNRYCFNKDDYSIYDSIVAKILPYYSYVYSDQICWKTSSRKNSRTVSSTICDEYAKTPNYKGYNELIGRILTLASSNAKGFLLNTTVTAVWEAIEYNVTVTGGTASVGAGTPITKATMGTTVTLTANAAPSGKVFDKWVVESGNITLGNAKSPTTTFTMPDGAVSVKATYKTITYGDLNGDDKINLLDLIALRKHLAKWSIEIDMNAADCNADGNINLLDLILMRKYLAKWNVVLGPQK